VEYAVSRNTVLNTEVAMSDYNVNTFSTKDKETIKVMPAVSVEEYHSIGRYQKRS